MALEKLANNLRIIGAFELSLAKFFGNSFDVSGQSTAPQGVAFNPDGTRMFVIGTSSDRVFQYSLSTDFDLSTASFTGTTFDVSGQDINPREVAFKPDGSGMFIIGADNDSVFEYLVGRLTLQE
jgi:DNA-binding beta-propeller fold protein YncE